MPADSTGSTTTTSAPDSAPASAGTESVASAPDTSQGSTQTSQTQDRGQTTSAQPTAQGESASPAAPSAPDTARVSAILSEAGYSAEDITELGAAAARVAARVEADWAGLLPKPSQNQSQQPAQQTPTDPKSAGKPPEPMTPPAAPGSQPGPTGQAIAKLSEYITQNYEPELANHLKGALSEIADTIRQEMGQHVEKFSPVSQMVASMLQEREASGINGFFDKLTSDARWSDRYGKSGDGATGEQLKARAAVRDMAYQLADSARSRGMKLSGEQILQRAHLLATREISEAQAVKKVQDAVVRQSRQVSIPPGTAGSGQQSTGDWRAAARAHVASKLAEMTGGTR